MPILVHYLTQRILQMDKFWENSESDPARSMHFPTFLAYCTILISINRESRGLLNLRTFVELNGFIQVLLLIEGSFLGSREKSVIKYRHFCKRKTLFLYSSKPIVKYTCCIKSSKKIKKKPELIEFSHLFDFSWISFFNDWFA